MRIIINNTLKHIHPFDKYIGQKLKQKRCTLGWSQTRLGKAVNLTFQQIQKYENGHNRISCSMLYEIAKALNISVNYFFRDLEPQTSDVSNNIFCSNKLIELENKIDEISDRLSLINYCREIENLLKFLESKEEFLK